MNPSIELAQAMVDFLAFFMPGFIVFVVVEWAISLFRRDG